MATTPFSEAPTHLASLNGMFQGTLVASLLLMISGKESDAHLNRLATPHGARHLDIPAHLYGVWLESLVQAVAEYDPMYSDEIGAAWRTTMERGFRLMKSKA